MEAIHVASTPAELYNAVLVDTPLGKHYIRISFLVLLHDFDIIFDTLVPAAWLKLWEVSTLFLIDKGQQL